MFAHLCDPELPALTTLRQADLDRITGRTGTRLLRARYQPGARAILHVALGPVPEPDEGSIWFYAGTKAQGLGRRLPDARLDAKTGALFQAFPQDHRMPQLAHFLDQAMQLAPDLLGGPAAGPPRLIRYRPGLSATFRWTATDGRVIYVKQTPAEDVAAHAATVAELIANSEGQHFGFTPVTGMIPDLGLIAYAAAEGTALDHDLAGSGVARTGARMSQVARTLAGLSDLPVSPTRRLDRSDLLRRAAAAQRMIVLLDPVAGNIAVRLVAGLHALNVTVRHSPIHADMKLEHAFLSGPRTTLIDIESLSMGDPDYDLAALQARLEMATLAGGITGDEADAATSALHPFTGPHYPWFLTCARLQCAKYFAQRFDPATIPQMRQILGQC